jgi:hypothetical protein
VLDAGFVLNRLVRRDPGGHQHDSVEPQVEVRLLRANKMTQVRRIERSAEDSDAHGS